MYNRLSRLRLGLLRSSDGLLGTELSVSLVSAELGLVGKVNRPTLGSTPFIEASIISMANDVTNLLTLVGLHLGDTISVG